MARVLRKIVRITILGMLVLMAFGLIDVEKAEAKDITFKIIAVNPSKTKTQKTQIKKYLPEEISPNDIIDTSGLELEYDTDKSLYYIYKKELELAPGEIRTFEIGVKDVWKILDNILTQLKDQTDSIMKHLINTDYYQLGQAIADNVYQRLEQIRAVQNNEDLSREQHIGVYRQNLTRLKEIKEDIARIEKILVTAGGPQAPEILTDTKIQSDSPSKTMTWVAIFSIIVFSGFLAGALFFTWHRQSHDEKEEALIAKEEAFPTGSSEEEEDA